MKVWELDREFDGLISFVKTGREGKKRDVREAVLKIREAALSRGDSALVDFSIAWDGWERPHPLKLTPEEIDEAASRVPARDLSVLKGMIRNVVSLPQGTEMPKRAFRKKARRGGSPGARGKRHGLRPGGTASYPSSLIMGVVPAQIAGVRRICAATPGRGGAINGHVAAAAKLLGIGEIYRVGGAQAVYAFAFGTGSVPKVDMIVGPGNAYVEEAKRDVYGSVGIDMLAGPTELVILCTRAHSPEHVALDMFSQAEHDELASVGLFSSSREHLEAVVRTMEGLLAAAPRGRPSGRPSMTTGIWCTTPTSAAPSRR
jgi:histidinol dehydrogenase